MTFADKLRGMNACMEAVQFVEAKTLAEAWEQCQRADWMLWLCEKMEGKKGWPTKRDIWVATYAAIEPCVYAFTPLDEERPIKALEAMLIYAYHPTSENQSAAWSAGDAARAAARAAGDAARAAAWSAGAAARAAARAAAWDAAWDAARAAVGDAAWAAARAAAWDAAWDAARAAARAAARDAAWAEAQSYMADMCRGYLWIGEL